MKRSANISKWLKSTFLVLPLLSLALLYQLLLTTPPRTFLGFEPLSWERLDGCRILESEVSSFGPLKRIVTWKDEAPNNTATCTSTLLPARGNYVEFELAGYLPPDSKENVSIQILSKQGTVLGEVQAPRERGSGIWKLRHVLLTQDLLPSEIRLVLLDQATEMGWLSLRNKVNFYHVSPLLYSLHQTLRRAPYRKLVLVLFAASLAALLLLPPISSPAWSRWLLFFLLGIMVHGRINPFFYGDDWLFFERFSSEGLGSTLITHNEHLLPLFTAWFFFEHLVLGSAHSAYLLVGLTIHALNALLLERLLCRLLARLSNPQRTSFLLSSCYLLSALHSQTLQWATCQSTLLMILCSLGAFHAALSFGRKSSLLTLMALFLLTLAAPFFFGAGFLLLLEIPLIVWLGSLAGAFPTTNSTRSQLRTVYLPTTFAALLGTSLALVAYLIVPEHPQTPHSLQLPATAPLLRYVLLGSQFAALVRGLGLVMPRELHLLYSKIPSWFTEYAPADVFFTSLGLFLSLLLLFYAIIGKQRKTKLACFLLGQALLILPFALSSLTRTSWGIDYAMALRYQSTALLGVCFLLAPCLSSVLSAVIPTQKQDSTFTHCFFLVCFWCLISLHLFSQLRFSAGYRYYATHGVLTRAYLEQTLYWLKHPGNTSTFKTPSFSGNSTKLFGLSPLLYGGHPKSPTAVLPAHKPTQMIKLISKIGSSTP